ncbi:helix-turn-helix domain-containing protein [Rhodohalobacter sp. SW132]|uniref:helix-turn-helix domain-containing protein n=1 Tax=Rhodohalobacter sp. SW132 TaxID=2293433 RepID=UPI000E21C4F2|nr:helix-turn-helix domain-containing protein [Rhodohalobacter sp. SW132]REL32988.1 helix-turn-helix domain-containing protein [Rhodohalobacter sp. SW132]
MEALKLPTRKEQMIARENKKILDRIAEKLKTSTKEIEIEVQGEKDPIKIPVSALQHLNTIIDLMAQGKAVTVNPVDAEITTQEAADLLNVSRPYIVKLLEGGEVPFHKVGSHRRIKLKDFLAYKNQYKNKQREALDELAKQAQELDMGY